MVRVLIDLRRTLARRQLAGTHAAVTWSTVALVLLSAIGTLLLGLADHDDPGAGVGVVALTSLSRSGRSSSAARRTARSRSWSPALPCCSR